MQIARGELAIALPISGVENGEIVLYHRIENPLVYRRVFLSEVHLVERIKATLTKCEHYTPLWRIQQDDYHVPGVGNMIIPPAFLMPPRRCAPWYMA